MDHLDWTSTNHFSFQCQDPGQVFDSVIKKLGKETMKGSPPKTPLEKVKKRKDSTGEESSPDIMVARKCDVLLATSSTGVVKKQVPASSSKRSFLDNLLDSALATELSVEEKQIVKECRTTMPANANGLTVKKRLNQAKKRNANSGKKKGVPKSKAKKPAKVLAKHLGNNMSKAKTGSSGATGDVNEAVKKQVKKKKRNKKQQRRMNTTSTVKTNKDNKKKHDEEVEPPQESQEINKKRTAVACWSQEDLGSLPRSKARHVITSRAYHQALTIHSVKKKDESKMTAEEIEAQNTKARELARAAGKEAGAEFDKKRPKEQEEKKKPVVDVD